MMVGCADKAADLEGDGGWAGFSSEVQAVCSYAGVSDLAAQYKYYEEVLNKVNSPIVQFMGETPKELPDTYASASPITYVNRVDPPLLLVHGSLDLTVSFTQSEAMYQTYKRAVLDATLIEVEGE